MQMKLTHNSKTNVTISVVADDKTLSDIKQSVVQSLNSPSLKIAGFRAGKAPLNLVEKHLDPQMLQSEFIDTVLNHAYMQVVRKENLRVAGQPQVNLKKFVPFTTFECEITVDVLGEVRLPDYTKMKVTKEKAAVTADEVKEVLTNLQKQVAEKNDVDRAAKDGDQVWIDFKGVDSKGEPVQGADGKDYPLALGSKTFIPGFEENLIGLKAGEEKTFTLTFPKDYGVSALQNKKITFTCTVTKVQEVVLPKLDDAFAAKAGPFKDLASLKADIKTQLTAEKQRNLDNTLQEKLLDKIAAKTEVAIPESIITEQVMRIEQDERQNLMYRGTTWEDHLKEEGVTEEEHRKRNQPEAERQVKIGVMLGAIGDKEKVEVTPEELEIRMQLLKGQYQDPSMQAELNKPEARQDIAARIRTEKIIEKLVAYATK